LTSAAGGGVSGGGGVSDDGGLEMLGLEMLGSSIDMVTEPVRGLSGKNLFQYTKFAFI